jgi:hypothetical protein
MLAEGVDYDVLGNARTGIEAEELVEQERPDVLVLDLALQGIAGLDITASIRDRAPDSPSSCSRRSTRWPTPRRAKAPSQWCERTSRASSKMRFNGLVPEGCPRPETANAFTDHALDSSSSEQHHHQDDQQDEDDCSDSDVHAYLPLGAMHVPPRMQVDPSPIGAPRPTRDRGDLAVIPLA